MTDYRYSILLGLGKLSSLNRRLIRFNFAQYFVFFMLGCYSSRYNSISSNPIIQVFVKELVTIGPFKKTGKRNLCSDVQLAKGDVHLKGRDRTDSIFSIHLFRIFWSAAILNESTIRMTIVSKLVENRLCVIVNHEHFSVDSQRRFLECIVSDDAARIRPCKGLVRSDAGIIGDVSKTHRLLLGF
jgi:hypothetical protein